MAQTIQLRRGLKTNLPTTGLSAGEPLWSSDRGVAHVAVDATTTLPLVPAIDDLTTLASVNGANDLLIIHDESQASGQKEKKITVDAFRTALNIPAGSTDELVAVVSGGTSGYLWGTNGTDGVLRAGAAIAYTKDAGNAFVTLNVADDGITTAKIANDAVTTAKIAAGAVGATELGTDAVTTVKINNAAVTTAKIATGAITNALLAASALDVNATTFSGNGVTVELDVAVIDGGSF